MFVTQTVEFDTEVDVDIDIEVGKQESQTLPMAQRSRGLSVLDQISFSESLLSIIFKISTKHQHLD